MKKFIEEAFEAQMELLRYAWDTPKLRIFAILHLLGSALTLAVLSVQSVVWLAATVRFFLNN